MQCVDIDVVSGFCLCIFCSLQFAKNGGADWAVASLSNILFIFAFFMML